MSIVRFHVLAIAFLLTLVPFPVAQLRAEDAGDSDTGKELVARALQAELKGDASSRSALLDQAIATDANCAPARWHSGQIRINGEWLTLSDAATHFRNDSRLMKYRDERDKISNSPTDQLGFARWCRRNDVAERGDTHLIHVLYGDQSSKGERTAAAKMLKWSLYRGTHVPTSEVPMIKKLEREQRDSASKWAKRVATLTDQLASRVKDDRDVAESELRSIQDVNAIGALESILSPSSEHASLLTISILGKIPEHAATQSLVRQAVLSPWPAVVNSAIAQLKLRPRHDYVPYLLGALETPIHFTSDVKALDSGHIVRSFAVFREGVRQDQAHFGQVISSPIMGGVSSLAGTPDPSQNNATSAAVSVFNERSQQKFVEEVRRSVALQQRVAAENVRIVQDNARVYEVLERVNDAKVSRAPVDWWNWWRDYNEVYDPAHEYGKPTVFTSGTQQDYYAASYQLTTTSCFVKGTLVWSELGGVPIEELQVGDRVLTQDPETGELSFQGIINCTVRPPSEILRLTVVGNTTTPIDCTKGHPFWVNGSGWKMAKELRPGDWLHTVTGPVEVASIEKLPTYQPAHNLLVAGNGSYFVGPLGLLVHDNTYRAPTLSLVPGLAQARY